MLMIRMARFGAKKKPSYRVVVIDKERARNSRSVEVVGLYNPVSQPQVVKLNHERIAYWMKNGAQPSDTVSRLMKKNPPTPEPVAAVDRVTTNPWAVAHPNRLPLNPEA